MRPSAGSSRGASRGSSNTPADDVSVVRHGTRLNIAAPVATGKFILNLLSKKSRTRSTSTGEEVTTRRPLGEAGVSRAAASTATATGRGGEDSSPYPREGDPDAVAARRKDVTRRARTATDPGQSSESAAAKAAAIRCRRDTTTTRSGAYTTEVPDSTDPLGLAAFHNRGNTTTPRDKAAPTVRGTAAVARAHSQEAKAKPTTIRRVIAQQKAAAPSTKTASSTGTRRVALALPDSTGSSGSVESEKEIVDRILKDAAKAFKLRPDIVRKVMDATRDYHLEEGQRRSDLGTMFMNEIHSAITQDERWQRREVFLHSLFKKDVLDHIAELAVRISRDPAVLQARRPLSARSAPYGPSPRTARPPSRA